MDKQRNLDQLFQLAKQDQVVQSFEQTKDRFVSAANASVNSRGTKQVFTKKQLIMFATVSTLDLSLFLLLGKGGNQKSTPQHTQPERTASQKAPVELKSAKTEAKPPVLSAKSIPFVQGMQELLTELPLASESNEIEDPKEIIREHQTFPPILMDEEPYAFPKLTEEEIALTKKKKKAMLKALVKHDKNAYAYIPSGSFDYNGQLVSAQAFYMGTTEVTNFEYRTFLFDLLIQGRKDEFLKAKPDQAMWTTAFTQEGKPSENAGKAFQEHYFSHKAFNEYPVVNISREGAELYCKWLSQEVRKSVGDEKEGQYNDVRLPIRAEWVKAASNEGQKLPYSWGGPYTRDSRGLILANYLRMDEEATQTTAGTKPNDVTAPSKSFWPNERGIYNLCGNVAEMVYEGSDLSEPGTAGGSWKNTEEEIQIYAPDPNKGITVPKPTIGFRVVSTYLILYK